MITKLIRNLRNSHGEFNRKHLNGICTAEDFYRIIKRERARVDRGGHPFAVIDFNLEKSKSNGASAQILLKALSKRVRLTDESGWIDDNHIGVVLFNSGAGQACRLAAQIRDEISQIAAPLDYSVYTYPNSFMDLTKTGGNGGSGNTDDDSAQIQDPKNSDERFFSDATLQAVKDIAPLIVRKIPVWKRTIDILMASVGLLFCLPVFFLIGLLIKMVSPGPVFFKQVRIGYGGRRFLFLKFRTMKVDADTCAHQSYLSDLIQGSYEEDSERPMTKLDANNNQIIPFGKFLRDSCLDELPQLINVLRGEMSLVGPRPPIPYEAAEYLRWHNGRFDIVPGMTGLWQVSGKNRLSFKEMIRLDIRYARNATLFSDLKILCKTPLAVIGQFNSHRERVRLA